MIVFTGSIDCIYIGSYGFQNYDPVEKHRCVAVSLL